VCGSVWEKSVQSKCTRVVVTSNIEGSLVSFSPSLSFFFFLHLSFHRSSTKHSFPHDLCLPSLFHLAPSPPQSPPLPYLCLHSSFSLKIRLLTSLHQLSQGLSLRTSTSLLIGNLESSHTMSSTSPINGVKISGKPPTSQTVGHAFGRVLPWLSVANHPYDNPPSSPLFFLFLNAARRVRSLQGYQSDGQRGQVWRAT